MIGRYREMVCTSSVVSTSLGNMTLPCPCPPASPLTFQLPFEYTSLSPRNREILPSLTYSLI